MCDVFDDRSSDIAITKYNNELIHVIGLLQLAICHETNPDQSKSYKQLKCQNLKDHLKSKYVNHKVFRVEISLLGFLSDKHLFTSALSANTKCLPDDTLTEPIRTVIGNSYGIHRDRNIVNSKKYHTLFYINLMARFI